MKAQMCLEALRPHLYRACGQHIEHFIVTRQRINHKDTKQKNAPGQHTLDIIFFREIDREREKGERGKKEMERLILSAHTKWHLIFHVVHYIVFFFVVPTLSDVYVVFLSLTVINDSWNVELRPGILVSF